MVYSSSHMDTTINGEEPRPAEGMQRKYPDDPAREIFEAAMSGDAVLLSEVLQEMNSSERASALKTKMAANVPQHNGLKDAYIYEGREFESKFHLYAGAYNTTPLIVSVESGNLDCVKVLLKYKADIEDRCDYLGFTPLFVAAAKGNLNILSCLIENGADVNFACKVDNCTPLMLASCEGHLKLVTFLLEHGADTKLQDKNGKTALHYAAFHPDRFDVLSCLIDNGANVNACDFNNCSPLMIASKNGLVNVVTFLVKHGGNVDLQDKEGNTALHHASCSESLIDVSHKLLTLGASQLCNNQGLTPLLSASSKCKISVVEDLITRPEFTKEQRVDALELLGSSLATKENSFFNSPLTGKGFEYIQRGMKERFADSSHLLLKKPMDLEFQNRKESQTLEELVQIEGDDHAIIMESLMIRERILGTNNAELLDKIRRLAVYYVDCGNPICIELYLHAMKIAQSCDQSAISDLLAVTSFILDKTVQSYDFPREKVFLELLEQTVLEYNKQGKLRYKLELSEENLEMLFDSTMGLVQMIAKSEHYDEFKTSLKRVFRLNLRDLCGNTLLHNAVDDLIGSWNDLPPNCTDTVKLLLNEGFDANVVNNNGDTPLHRAVTFVPMNDDDMHVLTDLLEVLLDGGAHHDFVNNDGKTAMDIAETDEACMILLEKRTLKLECISARAVKKYGLPYLGIVPEVLVKYISMH